jgi:integrase
MRRREIIGLTWSHIDFKEGVIRLRPDDTKSKEGREVPLHDDVVKMLKDMPRGLPGIIVFTKNGKPIKDLRDAFERACKRADIRNFTFHDLRHTFNTNAYRAGVPIPTIMKITGISL